MKKTKIVCTIGPASESKDVFRQLVINGLDVARLNFSHGDHEEHGQRINTIKEVRWELNRPIAILLDTKGAEIRTGKFKDGEIELVEGQNFIITTRDVLGDNTISNVSYDGLPEDVGVGDTILIDDGLVGLKVKKIVNDTDIECIVENGGAVSNHKGVNVPKVKLNLPAVTEKDKSDIKFGIEKDVDFIAASFIRKASDVLAIREILENSDVHHIQIISKIENQEGLDNIDEIIRVSDGIMIARGDLGVEIPTEEIPLAQKEIIKKCNRAGKPVITATQMLDSMMRNPRPTRAEVTDVANAIFDGTDAIMLSGETAIGKYPVGAVKIMSDIAKRTESAIDYEELLGAKAVEKETLVTDAISYATCRIAADLGASAILTATATGFTARMENSLDDVEEGKVQWLSVLKEFWEAFTRTMEVAETARAVPPPAPEPIGENCPECGKPLVLKNGRFGEFIACSGYPACKYTRPVLVKTGAVCPKCGKGDVVKRKSRKGKPFYGCSRYPDCDFVSWNPPSGSSCPQCGASLMSSGKKGGEECVKCGYAGTREVPEDE